MVLQHANTISEVVLTEMRRMSIYALFQVSGFGQRSPECFYRFKCISSWKSNICKLFPNLIQLKKVQNCFKTTIPHK